MFYKNSNPCEAVSASGCQKYGINSFRLRGGYGCALCLWYGLVRIGARGPAACSRAPCACIRACTARAFCTAEASLRLLAGILPGCCPGLSPGGCLGRCSGGCRINPRSGYSRPGRFRKIGVAGCCGKRILQRAGILLLSRDFRSCLLVSSIGRENTPAPGAFPGGVPFFSRKRPEVARAGFPFSGFGGRNVFFGHGKARKVFQNTRA